MINYKLLDRKSKTAVFIYTQQNSYSISHCVITVDNCGQHGDRVVNDSTVTLLQAVVNSDHTVTVQSLSLVGD